MMSRSTKIFVLVLAVAGSSACGDISKRCPQEAAEAEDRNEAAHNPGTGDCHVCRARPDCNDLCVWRATRELSCGLQCRVLFTERDIRKARAKHCTIFEIDAGADGDEPDAALDAASPGD